MALLQNEEYVLPIAGKVQKQISRQVNAFRSWLHEQQLRSKVL